MNKITSMFYLQANGFSTTPFFIFPADEKLDLKRLRRIWEMYSMGSGREIAIRSGYLPGENGDHSELCLPFRVSKGWKKLVEDSHNIQEELKRKFSGSGLIVFPQRTFYKIGTLAIQSLKIHPEIEGWEGGENYYPLWESTRGKSTPNATYFLSPGGNSYELIDGDPSFFTGGELSEIRRVFRSLDEKLINENELTSIGFIFNGPDQPIDCYDIIIKNMFPRHNLKRKD